MTKAELIFYEMTDREIFSRAKTVYEKLGMSEKGLLSVMRPTMGSVTILSVDLTNKIIYNWDCGKNYELEEVIENVITTLDSLCTQKILWNTEKKRKKKHVQHNK